MYTITPYLKIMCKLLTVLVFYGILSKGFYKKERYIIQIQNFIVFIYLVSRWNAWIDTEWKVVFLNFVLGYLVTPIVFNFTFWSGFGEKRHFKFKSNMFEKSLINISVVIYEEIMWRHAAIIFFRENGIPFYIEISSLIVITVLFVFSHATINLDDNLVEIVEMLLFSVGLLVAAMCFPGANIGLHLCRNVLISQNKNN